MGRKIVLLVNRDKPETEAVADAVRSLIERHGTLASDRHALDADVDTSGADLIVAVGGDGTLLGVARQHLDSGMPMLGVNAGKLGYLAEFDVSDLEADGEALFGGGELPTGRMPVLAASVDSSPDAAGVALNECVVTAGPPYRVLKLGVRVNGHGAAQVEGDGLIVSTPLGSTAYNVSAGGPIAHPQLDALLVTPIAAHSLGFRPIVVPGSAAIEIEVLSANEGLGGQGTSLVLDGQGPIRVRVGQVVTVRTDPRRVTFVRNVRGNYWRTLSTKMHWARSPRHS